MTISLEEVDGMIDVDKGTPPFDFGELVVGEPDRFPWLMPVLGGVAFGAYMFMLILGKAPWQ
jgi:hypothetical protein